MSKTAVNDAAHIQIRPRLFAMPVSPRRKSISREAAEWSLFHNPGQYSLCSPGILILVSVVLELSALVIATRVWCFGSEFNEIVMVRLLSPCSAQPGDARTSWPYYCGRLFYTSTRHRLADLRIPYFRHRHRHRQDFGLPMNLLHGFK